MRPKNKCSACGLDFSSVAAFDEHRVGKHAYTLSEGLRMDPLREDGRRCLREDELAEKGYVMDRFGRWQRPLSERAAARFASLRTPAIP